MLSLQLVIKVSNKKERKNQKQVSTKCFLGATEKYGPFKKKMVIINYIQRSNSCHKRSSCGLKLVAWL